MAAPVFTVRRADANDLPRILELMPRLADFEVPQRRNPDHLWQGDAKLVEQTIASDNGKTRTLVAVDANDSIEGVAVYTLKPELLSAEPSAHLEVLLVTPAAEGTGLAGELIKQAESAARQQGALSMTLHVFGNNSRARRLYQKAGFDEELLRCSKLL